MAARRSAREKHEGAVAALPSSVMEMTEVEVRAVAGAIDQLAVLEKRVEHGMRRKAGRPSKPANSNDPLIVLLLTEFPDLLTVPVTRERITVYQRWLHAQPDQRRRSNDALAKAIRRARQ